MNQPSQTSKRGQEQRRATTSLMALAATFSDRSAAGYALQHGFSTSRRHQAHPSSLLQHTEVSTVLPLCSNTQRFQQLFLSAPAHRSQGSPRLTHADLTKPPCSTPVPPCFSLQTQSGGWSSCRWLWSSPLVQHRLLWSTQRADGFGLHTQIPCILFQTPPRSTLHAPPQHLAIFHAKSKVNF